MENLDRGAVETWLVRMLTHARGRGVDLDWTFYCALGREGGLDERARSLGADVLHSPVPIGNTSAFMRALRGELRRGRYDVMHCHHDLVSSVYLLAAIGLPIRRRIVHVHNADEALPTPSAMKQRLLREPMRRTCLLLADGIVGISGHTLDTFLRNKPRRRGRDTVHYYGIQPPVDAVTIDIREELTLPPDARILLFAGRLVPEKNPVFVVDVLSELRKLDPRAFAVFAGAGALRQEVESRASQLGVGEFVRMPGWRGDVPSVMASSDCFILPHPAEPPEGFGIAVVEAELAGLPLAISDGVPDDPLLPGALWRRLPVEAGAPLWAEAIFQLWKAPRPSRARAVGDLSRSPMDMDRALDHLLSLHDWHRPIF